MRLDMRGLCQDEPLKRIRDILRNSCPDDEIIEVLIESEQDAKRLRAFMSMSGCTVELLREGPQWIVKMTGKNCNCQ
ncbi:MAG: hypothetical protein ACK4TF_04625 [Thermodesulfovibrionales bacterium]